MTSGLRTDGGKKKWEQSSHVSCTYQDSNLEPTD